MYWVGGSVVLGWRFRCTGQEVLLYWVGSSIVLGRRFHCTGQEVPLYWAGGSIVLDSRFGYTGQWLLRRILFYGRFFLLVFGYYD